MIEISLVKKLTSICFCEERGREEGEWRMEERKRGRFAISIVPWPFRVESPNTDRFKQYSQINRINIPVV